MGIKRNFAYNSILTLSQYIFGLITFPYISRILGVSNIGIIGFADNAINYFILFSMMGINIIGQREVAKHQNDHSQLNIIFSSLLSLSLFTTLIILIIYFISIFFIPQFILYQKLFVIGAAKIIGTTFLVEWFYRGIENFRYISICNIVIKIIYIISIFFFIKEPGHYIRYFFLTTAVVFITAIVNILYTRKFVTFSLKNISLRPYFKQNFQLGSYAILTSMYTTFNVLYLGFVSNTTEVGYYWTALKIYTIILAFYSAFTGVMMPRMSNLYALGNKTEFNLLIEKSFQFLFSISFPIIILSIILAPEIIYIFSGQGYEGAIIPMQIIMSLLLIVCIAQILSILVLIPMQKDKLVFKASIIGALIGIILNILLVSKYHSIGTSVVLLISELSVTLFYIYVVTKNKILNFPWKILIKRTLLSIPYIVIALFFSFLFTNPLIIIFSSISIAFLYWIVIEFLFFKNAVIINFIKTIKDTLKSS